MSGYSVEGLVLGIERARHNIQVLTDAQNRELATIAQYEQMIRDLKQADKLKEKVVVVVERDDDGDSG